MKLFRPRARQLAESSRIVRAVLTDLDAESPPTSPGELRELAGFANEEKVLLPLAPWFERAALDQETGELIARVRRQADRLRAVEDALHEALEHKNVAHAFVKGTALARLDTLPRQRNDVDMVVPDEAAAWSTVDVLEGWGYRPGSFSVAATVAEETEWAGVVTMEHDSGSLVEVSFGDYYPHWFTRLLLPAEFWESTLTGNGSPSLRWSAAILVAELVERSSLRLRDERDITNVSNRLEAPDLEWLSSFASRRGLSAEWGMFRRHSPNGRELRRDQWQDRLRDFSLTATLMVRHDFAAVRRRRGSYAAVQAAVLSGLRDALAGAVRRGRTGRAIRAATRLLERIDMPVRLRLGGITPMIILTDREAGVDRLQMAPTPPFGRSLVRTPLGYAVAIPVPIISASRYQRLVSTAEALTGTSGQ